MILGNDYVFKEDLYYYFLRRCPNSEKEEKHTILGNIAIKPDNYILTYEEIDICKTNTSLNL